MARQWFNLMWRNPSRTTTRAEWYAAQHWLRSCRRQIHEATKGIQAELSTKVIGRFVY